MEVERNRQTVETRNLRDLVEVVGEDQENDPLYGENDQDSRHAAPE